jgi:hypothetical protein
MLVLNPPGQKLAPYPTPQETSVIHHFFPEVQPEGSGAGDTVKREKLA